MMVAAAGLMGVGLLAQEGTDHRDHQRPDRQADGRQQGQGGQGRMQLGMGGMMMGGMDGMREAVIDQVLARLEAGSLPEEIRPMAEELRLVRMRMSAVDRRLQERGDALLETPDLNALYLAYQEALQAYIKAMDANEKIRASRERLVEIERNRDGMMAGMRDDANRREIFQRMRDEMGEQRRLTEEISAQCKQDEAIRKAAQAKAEAAAAVMAKHGELLAQDADVQTCRTEREMLRTAERELLNAMMGSAAELGLLPAPMNRGGGRGDRQPGQQPGDLPQAPEPAGLDAGGGAMPLPL
jgi:hypothetical protein